MKKKIDLGAVLVFLLTVAFFIAEAKGHGTGQLGKGFFNGG